MYKQKVTGNTNDKRLLGIKEVCSYLSLGQNTARAYMDEIGATKHFGKRVLFDKAVIDEALTNK